MLDFLTFIDDANSEVFRVSLQTAITTDKKPWGGGRDAHISSTVLSSEPATHSSGVRQVTEPLTQLRGAPSHILLFYPTIRTSYLARSFRANLPGGDTQATIVSSICCGGIFTPVW